MSHKTIHVTLTESGVDKAIAELTKYKEEFLKKCNRLLAVMADRGMTIAKIRVAELDAYYTGDLYESIEGYFDEASRTGIVKAGAWYAVYVEYGTGIVGANSPHPDGGWAYDINGHGEDGWDYIDRWGVPRHTTGMRSRPFMYDARKYLEQYCKRIAKEVFGA